MLDLLKNLNLHVSSQREMAEICAVTFANFSEKLIVWLCFMVDTSSRIAQLEIGLFSITKASQWL